MDWEFLIADVTKPIIGADFLYEFDLIVDVRRKKLIDRKTKLEVNGIGCTNQIEQIFTFSPSCSEFVKWLLNKYKDLTQPIKIASTSPTTAV